MKAIVIKEFGGPEVLELRELPDLEPGSGELRIQVKATALNRADLLQRRGFYPPPRGASELLGLECAGVVDKLGSGVESVALGTRVMALLPGGGYAEQAIVPSGMAIPIPDNLDFNQAAAIPEAFLTAREALFTLGQLQARSHVLVHAAAGGVGSAAVQLAHQHGAHVFATAGSDEKLEHVAKLGADTLINYKQQDFAEVVKQVAPRGVELVLDFVGGSYWDKHAACMAVGGRCVVIGVMGSPTANVNLAQLLMKRLQILGLVMRSRPLDDKLAITKAFVRESLPLFSDGRLKPVVDSVLPLAEARAAHERMEQNLNVGKIILVL